jgi:hypothetical protein
MKRRITMTKYIINGHEFDTAEETADYIIDNMDDDAFDEMLDETYGDIEICGYSYSASLALSRVDEIAYNCGRNDYYDSLRPDIIDELEDIDEGETSDVYGYEVEHVGEEEDEEE